MVSDRVWVVLNVSLGLVTFLLLITFFGYSIPNVGQVTAYFDTAEPICYVRTHGQYTAALDMNRCCLLAREQLACHKVPTTSQVDASWACHTGGKDPSYWMNTKAYQYCTQQRFW